MEYISSYVIYESLRFRDAAAAGSRVLSVSVDGIAVASGVDIFKDVGRNTAVGFAAPVTSIEDQMTVAVKSEVRMLRSVLRDADSGSHT